MIDTDGDLQHALRIIFVMGGGIAGYYLGDGMGIMVRLLLGIIGFFIVENYGGLILEMIKSKLSKTDHKTVTGSKSMKICQKCKKRIDEDYKSCPHCRNTFVDSSNFSTSRTWSENNVDVDY